jgi:hypothetical protein
VSPRRRAPALGAVLVAAAVTGGAAGAGDGGVVTPTGDTVPENLLRIELRLARPLAHPLAMDHVRLLDGQGHLVEGAFLDLPLPGADGRTLTLLLHPGRVKTGVGANLALGRALHAGEDVTLVVDDPRLGAPLRKQWHVVPAQDEALLAGARLAAPPRAGSRGPVSVRWPASLSASGSTLIGIRGPDGERLAGVATLGDGETTWRFVPAAPWRAGTYAVVVHPRLEDVAGNRPCAPFEARGLDEVECPQAELPFDVLN